METEKKERESPNDSTFASEESSEEETETAELKGKQSLGGPRKNDDSESPSSPEPAMPGKHVEKTVEKAVSFGSNIPAPLASASVAPSSGSPGEGTQASHTVTPMSPLKPSSSAKGMSLILNLILPEFASILTYTNLLPQLPPISSVSTSSGSSRLARRALLGSLKSLLGALPMRVPGLRA